MQIQICLHRFQFCYRRRQTAPCSKINRTFQAIAMAGHFGKMQTVGFSGKHKRGMLAMTAD
jgi:hypothetical protein